MPYQAIAVRQAKSVLVSSGASPLSVSFDSAVAAGSAVVFVGSANNGATDQAALLGTVTGGGTWSAATNTRASGDYAPNTFAASVANLSAGSPTFSLPFTVGGVAPTADLRVSGVLLEIEKVPASAIVDQTVTGTSSGGATSTSTSATTTLAQTDNLLVLVAGGWFGIPQNPSGWTSRLSQQNGSFLGAQVSTRTVTTTTAQTGTVAHDATSAASAIMLVVKAANDATYFVEFEFPSAKLASAQANIECFMWRNTDPDGGAATKITGITAETGTKAGDATRRLVNVTTGLPAGTTLGDTIRAVLRVSGGTTKTSGIVSGTVKAS